MLTDDAILDSRQNEAGIQMTPAGQNDQLLPPQIPQQDVPTTQTLNDCVFLFFQPNGVMTVPLPKICILMFVLIVTLLPWDFYFRSIRKSEKLDDLNFLKAAQTNNVTRYHNKALAVFLNNPILSTREKIQPILVFFYIFKCVCISTFGMDIPGAFFVASLITFIFEIFYNQSRSTWFRSRTGNQVADYYIIWDWILFGVYMVQMFVVTVMYYQMNSLVLVLLAVCISQILSSIIYVALPSKIYMP